MIYLNENDAFPAAWSRWLMDNGKIPNGYVDTRSIEDVTPNDIAGYKQCHFFAGISGWVLAFMLAGIPADLEAWSASCPCQPFSTAGKGAGFADERHLWPYFHWLVQQRRPPIIFGEQVASKDAEPWIDLVQVDMEALDYTFGCVAFTSASVGSPQIRDRIYWVAYANDARLEGRWKPGCQRRIEWAAGAHGLVDRLANTNNIERSRQIRESRLELQTSGWKQNSSSIAGRERNNMSSALQGFWRDADWLGCRDGKWRPVEPGTFPLAHGISDRVGRLRGYGNAINPWQAAEFIKAVMA